MIRCGIVAEKKEDKSVVIELSTLLGDVMDFANGLNESIKDPANPLGSYRLDQQRSYFGTSKAFPKNVLIEALKRTGPQLDTEKLIDVLENMRDLDLGLGVSLGFGRAEHQASHKIWGTALDETGKYQAIELE